MYRETLDVELIDPKGIKDNLLKFGLQTVDLSDEELLLADEYTTIFRRLTKYDCIALAIAKCRNIVLLTGDKRLRAAAKQEAVETKGTIALIDELFNTEKIAMEEYKSCIEKLLEHNGHGIIRLPEAELRRRLEAVSF